MEELFELVTDMPRNLKTHPVKACTDCGTELPFDRSYGFHTGFSNCGFLYNDDGNEVFVWTSNDPDYISIVGERHPWTLSKEQQEKIEALLLPSESGGPWRFSNPARCPKCHAAISGPITETMMVLPFDGRKLPDDADVEIVRPFKTYLKRR